MKILVLDDSETMLRIISKTLRRMGEEDVTTAENGLVGLLEYQSAKENGEPFEIILTDWNMPEMNGLEFVKEVRKDNQDIPIIMITTEGGKAEVITALKTGVNNYIVKPFTPQVLKEKLSFFFN